MKIESGYMNDSSVLSRHLSANDARTVSEDIDNFIKSMVHNAVPLLVSLLLSLSLLFSIPDYF